MVRWSTKLSAGTVDTGAGDLELTGDACSQPAVKLGLVKATSGWDEGRRPDVGFARERLAGERFRGGFFPPPSAPSSEFSSLVPSPSSDSTGE